MVYLCVIVYAYVHVCVYVCTCICICMGVFMCMRVNTCTLMCTCTCMYVHDTHIHIHTEKKYLNNTRRKLGKLCYMDTCARIHIHIHIHATLSTHISYIHTSIHTYIPKLRSHAPSYTLYNIVIRFWLVCAVTFLFTTLYSMCMCVYVHV